MRKDVSERDRKKNTAPSKVIGSCGKEVLNIPFIAAHSQHFRKIYKH